MTAENVAQRDPRLAELSERYRIARSVIGDLVVEKTAATDAVDTLQQTIAQLVKERDQQKDRADELEEFVRAFAGEKKPKISLEEFERMAANVDEPGAETPARSKNGKAAKAEAKGEK